MEERYGLSLDIDEMFNAAGESELSLRHFEVFLDVSKTTAQVSDVRCKAAAVTVLPARAHGSRVRTEGDGLAGRIGKTSMVRHSTHRSRMEEGPRARGTRAPLCLGVSQDFTFCVGKFYSSNFTVRSANFSLFPTRARALLLLFLWSFLCTRHASRTDCVNRQ
eukprot:5934200-Prymnesium_polylepis.1